MRASERSTRRRCRRWRPRDGVSERRCPIGTTLCSTRERVGERIHRRSLSEGGFAFESEQARSFPVRHDVFANYDREVGSEMVHSVRVAQCSVSRRWLNVNGLTQSLRFPLDRDTFWTRTQRRADGAIPRRRDGKGKERRPGRRTIRHDELGRRALRAVPHGGRTRQRGRRWRRRREFGREVIDRRALGGRAAPHETFEGETARLFLETERLPHPAWFTSLLVAAREGELDRDVVVVVLILVLVIAPSSCSRRRRGVEAGTSARASRSRAAAFDPALTPPRGRVARSVRASRNGRGGSPDRLFSRMRV